MRECLKLLFTRHSTRTYTNEPIVDEDLKLILKAAISAPSGGNLQPWRIYYTKKQKIKDQLSKAAYNQNCIKSAPLVIIVCGIPEQSAAVYGERGRTLYYIQDTAAMSQNILLAAHALGYGAVWVGAFDEKKVSQILKLRDNIRPLVIIPIGKPKNQKSIGKTTRKPLENVAFEL